VVNNQVDSTSGTIRLKAVFDNKDHALWPGQSVSTRLLVQTIKGATVVPDDAIQHGTDGLYAFIVNQDNKAELRKLKVSQSIDGRSWSTQACHLAAGHYRRPVQSAVGHPRQLGCGELGCGATEGPAGMSEGISAPFIRYPIGTSLMMAGILFVGLVAYPLLPVAPLPQVDFPTIQVAAQLPGASPETMASSVAQPLERQLAQIPGIAQMTSTSYLGTTAVTIQFDLNRNIDGAPTTSWPLLTPPAASCPRTFPSPPTYRKVNPADSPILLLSATSDSLPLTTVSDSVDAQLAQQISQISGVAQVTIGGQQKPSIRVQVDPAKLVAKGLSLEDVRNQIAITTVDSRRATSTARSAPSRFTPTTRCWTRRTGTTSSSPTAMAAFADSRHRSGRDGTGGRQAGGLGQWQARRVPGGLQANAGANVIETVDKIKSLLPRLVAAIPAAIKIEVISDRTLTIRAAVDDVQFTLLLTIALVVMVIFVFLRSFWQPSFQP